MDVFGKALADYFYRGDETTLWLHNSYDEPEEMPVEVFFRGDSDMTDLEIRAMSHCYGRIVDAGAGVGAHTLLLQQKFDEVIAIERSETAVEIMKQRGVRNASCIDFFQYAGMKADTLLMLMNGIGLVGTLSGLKEFLQQAHNIVAEGGQIIFDSSDIRYLYNNGTPYPSDSYYGEIQYCYQFKQKMGSWFNWLYIDKVTLTEIASKAGWNTEILYENDMDAYLYRLIRK